MTAFWKGNFYSSSGIELKSVRFDRAKNTLSVSVKPEPGRRYRIVFIGSKRGCETDVRGYVFSTEDGKLLTAGGRVLGVTAAADDLQSALDKAYAAVKLVSFEKMHYRNDIGKRALAAKK